MRCVLTPLNPLPARCPCTSQINSSPALRSDCVGIKNCSGTTCMKPQCVRSGAFINLLISQSTLRPIPNVYLLIDIMFVLFLVFFVSAISSISVGKCKVYFKLCMCVCASACSLIYALEKVLNSKK